VLANTASGQRGSTVVERSLVYQNFCRVPGSKLGEISRISGVQLVVSPKADLQRNLESSEMSKEMG
jgi:hypothetical protein